MGRLKKKSGNPLVSMEQLVARAVELFEEPYDDRDGRDGDLPSVRFVAEEMDTTILRARKLLITAGYYSTEMSRKIRELHEQGNPVSEIMEATGLGQASVYSYLPYLGLAWNLEERTANADRLRVYRRRKNATENLIIHLERPDVETYLWKTVVAFEGYPFSTARGLRFSYALKRGKNGLPTAEIAIDRKEKTITKATICLAFRNANEIQKRDGYVSGPKKIGGFGASYLYPMFLRFGVIRQTPMTNSRQKESIIRSADDLVSLSKILQKSHSFGFATIDEAKKTVKAGLYSYTFDATTLLPYIHNLNSIENNQLDKLMHPFYKKMHEENREAYKELCERRVLLRFLLCSPEQYQNSVIEKCVRPDFVLRGEKRIGIEITKLTTPFDEEVFSLSNQIHENGIKQENEAIKHIKQYHKKIANRVECFKVSGSLLVCPGGHEISVNRIRFAEELKTKHDKYKGEIPEYDEFIILGNAADGSGLDISEKSEVAEVINHLLKICPDIIDTTVVIAWRMADHQGRVIYSWYKQVSNA